MTKITYRVNDTVDCLIIGADYEAEPSGRMIRFTNKATGAVVHVYPHDVQRALYRGALKANVLTDVEAASIKH